MDDEAEEKQIEEIREWSSFVLDEVIESKEKIKEKLQILQKDIDAGFDLKEEKIRALNLISYFHWRLGEREKAFKTMKKAQEFDESWSLITLCNEIVFHQEQGEYSQSRKLVEKFNNAHFKQKEIQTRAVAEIAYFYSRLGPKHHNQAVRLFRKAIEDVKPERNILWEFGLALTLQRQSHMFQMTEPEKFKPDDKAKEAASLLYEIVKFTNCTLEHCQVIGKAWCQLGKILRNKEHLFEIVNIDKTETTKINEECCFEKALKLCPDHYFILQSYGQQLRYWREFEKSKEMLEKAIQIQDMPFSRHHLAITLKKIVERDTKKPKCRTNLQRRFLSVDETQQDSGGEQYDSGISSMTSQLSSMSIGYQTEEQSSKHWKEGHTTWRHQSSRPFVRGSTRTSRPSRNAHWSRVSASRYQHRLNTPFSRSQLDPVHQTRVFNAMRKSPKSVYLSPDNPLLLSAVEHLEKALEMNKDFNTARYDLGLIYRMLDRTEDALNCFSFITSDNCGKQSEYKMTLINAFEQQGICKLEMKSKETDPGKQEELEYDAKRSMWKAVSVMSGVIGAIPMIKTSNQCFPTLKSLLLEGSESPKNLKELAKLHELLKDNEESIKFYKRLIEIESYNETTVKKLVQNYIEINDFENAICTLSLMQCTGELNVFDKSIYVETYITGANNSLEKRDFEMAKIRFLKAHQTIFSHQPLSSSYLEDYAESPAILLLHNCNEGDGCQHLKLITSTLKTFVQLPVAVNSDDCPPFRRQMPYLTKAMSDCHCILVLFHDTGSTANRDNKYIDSAIKIIPGNFHEKTLVINGGGHGHELHFCKELILTTEPCNYTEESDIRTLKQGTLLSDILTKMSEMF